MIWYRDPELLRKAWEEHGSLHGAARAAGLDASTLSKWARRLGVDAPVRQEAPERDGTDVRILAALKKHGDSLDVSALADTLDCSPKRVREALERLGHKGYRVAEEDHRVVLHRVPPPSENVHKALFKGETIRYGIVSDTHLGSKHERLAELHLAYEMLAEEGITTVYHPGDLVCGYGIFPGQITGVHQHTLEDQIDYAVANYPKVDGVTTYLIGGNHDLEGKFGKVGANPAQAVCNQRPDMEYLGDYNATVVLEQGTRLQFLHPKGSMGYAMDYKARKLVEGFEGGRKPAVLHVGHFHRVGWIEARSVHVLFCGCFEAGGSFGPRLGLPDPSVGFYVVEITVGDDGSIVAFTPRFRKFFPGRVVS
jgi:transposase-like protein